MYCPVGSTFQRILKLPNARPPASRYIKEKKILLHFSLWFGYFRNKQHLSGMKLEILYLFASISEMFPYICHSRSTEASGDTENPTGCHPEAADPTSPTVSFHWDTPLFKTTAIIKTMQLLWFLLTPPNHVAVPQLVFVSKCTIQLKQNQHTIRKLLPGSLCSKQFIHSVI